VIVFDKKKFRYALPITVLASIFLAFFSVFIPHPFLIVLACLLILLSFFFIRLLYSLLFVLFASFSVINYLALLKHGSYLYYYLALTALLLVSALAIILIGYFLQRKEGKLKKDDAKKYKILEKVFRHSPSPVAVLDKDLRCMIASESYLKEFDLDPEAIIGKKISSSFFGMPDLLKEMIEKCAKGDAVSITPDFTDKEEGPIEFDRWHCRPIKGPDGQLESFILNLGPLSAYKEGQKLIMDRYELQDMVFSSMPALVYIRDLELRFVMVNKAFCGFVGLQQEKIIGKTDYDFYSQTEARKMQKDDQKVIRSGQPKLNIEEAIKSKGNETVWLVANKLPLYDSLGNIKGVLGISWDVSLIKKAQAQLRALIDNFPYMAWLKDTDGKYLAANKEISIGSGKKMKEILGNDDFTIWPKELAAKYHQDDQKVMKERKQMIFEEYTIYKSKKIYSETIKRPIIDDKGNILGTVGFARDITDRKKMEEKIKNLAYYDTLTGLPNRILFNDRLSIAMEAAKRNKNILMVAMLDFNNFKAVNDTYGHDVGDQLLKDFSKRMMQMLRKADTIARMSGDEFLFICADVKTKKDMETLAKKILFSFETPFVVEGNDIKISGSMGICVYPENGEEPSVLIKNADRAMYAAKKTGENLFHFY
jgi:diguanylate cyclase (GGDEF)-like protein/PAS domain S-box-containing protein